MRARCDDSRLKDIYHIQQCGAFSCKHTNIQTSVVSHIGITCRIYHVCTKLFLISRMSVSEQISQSNQMRIVQKFDDFSALFVVSLEYLGASDKVFIFQFNPLVDSLSFHSTNFLLLISRKQKAPQHFAFHSIRRKSDIVMFSHGLTFPRLLSFH